MATIASVNINVVANAGRFQAGMKAAEVRLRTFSSQSVVASKKTQQFARHMAESAKTADRTAASFGVLSRVGGTLLVLFSGRALARGFQETIASLDQLAKLANRIGITQQKLAGLQFAGEITGVSVDDLNASLERFNRRTAEASLGTGEAINVIKQLGLDAKQIAALPLDRRLEVVADRIAGLSTTGLKANAAFKLFGDSGFRLLNFLNEGEGGLRALTDEFDRLNGNLGRAALEAEAVKDAFTRAGVVWERLKRELAIGVTPAVRGGTDALTEMGVSVSELPVMFSPLVQIGTIFDHWRESAELAEKGFINLSPAVVSVSDDFEALAEASTKGQELLEKLRDSVAFFGKDSDERTFAKLLGAGALDSDQTKEITFLIGKLRELKRLEDEMEESRRQMEQARGAAARKREQMEAEAQRKIKQRAEDARRRAADVLKENRNPFEVFQDGVKELNKLFLDGLLTIQDWEKAAKRLGKELLDEVPLPDISRAGGVAALEAGSAGAFSAVNRHQERMLTAAERAERHQKVLTALTREQNKILREQRIRIAEIPG